MSCTKCHGYEQSDAYGDLTCLVCGHVVYVPVDAEMGFVVAPSGRRPSRPPLPPLPAKVLCGGTTLRGHGCRHEIRPPRSRCRQHPL